MAGRTRIDIEVGEIFYVNPFLQVSAFNPQEEVIGLYFWVKPLQPLDVPFREKPLDFDSDDNDQQVFRWIAIQHLQGADFTFPIDQSLVPHLQAFMGLE